MSAKSVIDSYKTIYRDMDFERLDLFRLIEATYHCREVLYPGCSIHVTPSFVFPHVVYVDKSAEAKTFFDGHAEVLDFVARNREYKRKPFIQFFHQDYSAHLPLQQESFDLLLSFFAGTVAPACEEYLRRGGLLLTNQRGEVDAVSGFGLVGTIRFQGGKYQFASEANILTKEAGKKYLRQSNQGLKYVERETYLVFEKRS